MKTGPHSFTDPTGVEWHIEGYSRLCGAGYVDCRTADGIAITVRPVAYLAPAGLTIPADAPPPERPATSPERAQAQKRYDEMPVKDIVPEAEQAEAPKPKRKPRAKKSETVTPDDMAQVIPIRPLEPITAEAMDAARDLVGELQAAMADNAIGAEPGAWREATVCGRFVMFEPRGEDDPVYVTSWDTWEGAQGAHAAAFPIPPGLVLRDDATGNEWKEGPCACGDCFHRIHGCIICGDRTGECTTTSCEQEAERERLDAAVRDASPEKPCQLAPGDTAAPGRARVTNVHREGYDVLIARPGPWGNPYSHEQGTGAQHVVETRERAIDLYREWLRQRVRDGEPGLVQALASLHGLRLGCYCAPLPCHGDVLADAAEWAIKSKLG